MNNTEKSVTWVVYRMTLHRKPSVIAVCEQEEWDVMEGAQPGHHKLVQAGIASEGEAERLARSAPATSEPVEPKLPSRS